MNNLARLAFALVMTAGVTACEQKKSSSEAGLPEFGSPDAPASAKAASPSKPLPRPCSLVSTADAQAITGQPMSVMGDEAELCAYNSTGSAGSFTTLMVNLGRHEDEEMAIEIFRGIAGLPGKLNKMVNDQIDEKTRKSGQTLDGLGNEARLSSSNADLTSNTSLVVRKGRVVLNLSVIGMDGDPETGTRLETLARKIVGAL